jgi:hypothetical protein
LAQQLIETPHKEQSEPEGEASPEEFDRLSLEGLAAAALFQCFCRACPARDHRIHTAYLSLSLASENVFGPETECHMAIQSRIRGDKDLTWLRVVSAVCKVNSNPAHEPEQPRTPVAIEIPFVPESAGHKRKLSADAALPPSKMLRPDAGRGVRRRTDPELYILSQDIPNQIQVCPEYLVHHEGPDLLAMQMGDASSVCHSIYFLPANKRPLEKCEPISFANMLRECKRPGMALKRGQDLVWIVRVARLIAEAVLRFDWPDSRCRWGKEDVMFYPSNNSTQELEPFLKVEIESQEQTESAIDDRPMTNGRSRALLNLGFILLQLGLFKHIDAPPQYLDEKRTLTFMLGQIKTEDIKVSGGYLEIVRRCATFLSDIEDDEMDELEFRETYYNFIVSPLKGIETELLSVRKQSFSTRN